MNLDELAQELGSISSEKPLHELVRWLEKWKSDNETVRDFEEMVERFFGSTWLESEADHSKAYDLWLKFKHEAIDGIDGMTMNERLFFFGLFDRFDQAIQEDQKHAVYSKLLARP